MTDVFKFVKIRPFVGTGNWGHTTMTDAEVARLEAGGGEVVVFPSRDEWDASFAEGLRDDEERAGRGHRARASLRGRTRASSS